MSVMSARSGGFEITVRWIWITFLLSLLVHIILGFFAAKTLVHPMVEEDFSIPVEVVTAPPGLLPVLDIPDLAESKEIPEDAALASDKNIKVLKESGGLTRPQESLTTKRPSVAVKTKPKTYSFSQDDLLKENDFERETLSENQRGAPSEAFLERLRRGNELKANAKLFDYGQYINRMREKIRQRWNPHGTVSAEMFNQRVVVVSIAVVLDPNGEIVELRNMATSRFKRYDDEALRTLRESGPFPNPPESLKADDGNIYMTWVLNFEMVGWGPGKKVE